MNGEAVDGSPTMGLEPTISPLGGVRRIHWATRAWKTGNFLPGTKRDCSAPCAIAPVIIVVWKTRRFVLSSSLVALCRLVSAGSVELLDGLHASATRAATFVPGVNGSCGKEHNPRRVCARSACGRGGVLLSRRSMSKAAAPRAGCRQMKSWQSGAVWCRRSRLLCGTYWRAQA